MNIILYTTHCPKCNVLESKLNAKGIQYKKVDDVDTIVELGFMEAPILKVEEKIMSFAEANKWINEQEGK